MINHHDLILMPIWYFNTLQFDYNVHRVTKLEIILVANFFYQNNIFIITLLQES